MKYLEKHEEDKKIEVEIDLDGEKPYFILALSLCTLCGILSKVPKELLAQYSGLILERCDAELTAISEDFIVQTCRALALLAELVGNATLEVETYSVSLVDRASDLIKSTSSKLLVTSAGNL
jgi:hypothetical protein